VFWKVKENDMRPRPVALKKPRQPGKLKPYSKETVMDLIVKLSCDESGATSVEYAFLIALIAVAIASGIQSFGEAVRGLFQSAATSFPSGS
jgi:Flp pilus assembly pilin Flp